jgi:NitT/TauT family transport system substrate-binding protein
MLNSCAATDPRWSEEMRNTIFKVALAALLASPLAASPALAQSAGTPLSAVVISVSVTIWPAIVADKKGYFKDEGLDLDFINSGASTRSVQQVAAGSAPIGSSSMVDTLRAIDKGAKVKVFLNSLAVGTHSLIGAKGLKTVKELKGKRVMTGGTGDITNLWWIAMAKANGLDPEKSCYFPARPRRGSRRWSRARSTPPCCRRRRASRRCRTAMPISARSRPSSANSR